MIERGNPVLLKTNETTSEASIEFATMTEYALIIKNLAKTYENGFEALKGIDLAVQPGDFYALLGPNGAGKSTAIGIICSLINKTAGSVHVHGVDIDVDFATAKSYIGIVPQEVNFNVFESPWSILVNQAGYYGIPRHVARENADKHLQRLGLWEKRAERSRNLSGGMKRRLMIARALMHNPRLLILDEPTAGVDIELRRSMWDYLSDINKAGTTIILTTHYLEEAEQLCRNIGIIDHGELLRNTTMKSLLSELHTETFVMDVVGDIDEAPRLANFKTRMRDSHSFEIDVERGSALNDVFAILSNHGVNVSSMRNKSNRLEQLFVSMLEDSAERRQSNNGAN